MKKINKLIKLLKDSKILIQSHNYPDPDSISSAVALQYILKLHNIKSKIVYGGEILNSGLLNIIKKYKLKLYHIESLKNIKKYKIIIVDTQFYNKNLKKINGEYIAEIDHHTIVKKSNLLYKDVRENVGSCSSIISEYLLSLNLSQIPEKIATLLLIGLYIDTNRFVRKTTLFDIKILYKLYKYADIEYLNYITTNSITMKDLDYFKNGLENIKRIKDIGIINIGEIKSPHILAITGDFFIQLQEINLIISYAIKGKFLFISIRSEIKKYDASIIAKIITENIGEAGGHYNMAAGAILLKNIKDMKNFSSLIIKRLKKYNLL